MTLVRTFRTRFSIVLACSVLVVGGAALAQDMEPGRKQLGDSASPLQAGAAPLAADELVDRVQAFYDKTRTFRAEFKQRYFVAAYRKTKDSQGTVTFQKPGKMSWRYTNNGNRVVSDGKRIRVYENENKQMYEQTIDKS